MIRKRIIPGRYVFLFLLLMLPLFIASGADTFAANADTHDSHLSTSERHYKKAKDYYYRLLRDKSIQDNRLNWVKGAGEFRRIYLESPKGEMAPNCLFMLATLHYRMYLRFHFESDLEESITYYRDVWLLFPDNSLADDAMYFAAEKYRKHKNNPNQAAQIYAKQIKRYPDGDKYAQAVNRLREINDSLAIAERKRLGLPTPGKEKVKVLPVQYWSSDDYSRIVIRSSGPVSFQSKLNGQTGRQPRKLSIDFAHSIIDRQYTVPVSIKQGLLRQIHSIQHDPETVRIELYIESISTYKIFSLNDPFRVIVDIHGQQKVLAASKQVPILEQERSASSPKKILRQSPTVRPTPDTGGEKAASLSPLSGQNELFVVLHENNKRKPEGGNGDENKNIENELSLAQQLGLGVRRIVIDPGHGGKDPGAIANGLKEKDITLKVGRKTAEILRSEYKYEVILTREDDHSLPLEERTAIANTTKADLFVSVHVNAHPNKSTRGVETFYLNLATNTEAMRVAARENATSTLNISDLQDILTDLMQNSKIQESSILAEYVQEQMVSGLRKNKYPTADLGVKQAPFYVLIGAEMPAILAEISFISNPRDAKRLRQEEYLTEIAGQIAAGVAEYVEHQTTAALQL